MKEHPRARLVHERRLILDKALIEATDGLTSAERIQLVTNVMSDHLLGLAKYAIRFERHGDANGRRLHPHQAGARVMSRTKDTTADSPKRLLERLRAALHAANTVFEDFPDCGDGDAEVRVGNRAVLIEVGQMTWKVIGKPSGPRVLLPMGFCDLPFNVEAWARWLQGDDLPKYQKAAQVKSKPSNKLHHPKWCCCFSKVPNRKTTLYCRLYVHSPIT